MHTQMSQMDGVTPVKDLIKRAMKWGMKSIAITDHGVVQSFPDAHKMLGYDNPDMKVIYGVEAYLVPDKSNIVSYSKNQNIETGHPVAYLLMTSTPALCICPSRAAIGSSSSALETEYLSLLNGPMRKSRPVAAIKA